MDENKKMEKEIEKTLKWAEGLNPLAEAKGGLEPPAVLSEAVKEPKAKAEPHDHTNPISTGKFEKIPKAIPLEPEVVDPLAGPIPGSSVAPPFTNRVGRPTKFFPQYIELAKVLASKGFTDLDLAEAFSVAESTIYLWKTEHTEFSEALKAGKEMIDDNVEKSLLQSAIGYSHPEEKVFCHEGAIITHQTIKHYPPNAGAGKMWLTNRRPDVWREKHDIEFINPFQIVMDEADIDTL